MWVLGFSQTFCNFNPSNVLVVVYFWKVFMQRVEKWIITKKRPFHIDSDASTDQVFTLLDAVLSDNADEIDELMNDL